MTADVCAGIPEDLRELRDFPVYDTTFTDGPKFRQQLSLWVLKTDKIATNLTKLADAFELFHSMGLKQHQAATTMVECMQDISRLCTNNRGDTIAGPLQQFAATLQDIWCYYDTFLEQTLMLNAQPVRQLADNFNKLKKTHEEVIRYRKEYIAAAEELCACKHMSKLTDKTTFTTLAEACFTAQRTYQVALSDYIIAMRQCHTEDMVTLVARIIEHILSLYSYFNFSAQMLKDLEPVVNNLFSKTKDWKSYYEEELKQWCSLHDKIQKYLMADFQHSLGLLPSSPEGGSTWYIEPLSNTAQLGKNMFKRIFPSSPTTKTPPQPQSPTTEWCIINDSEMMRIESSLDDLDSGNSTLRRHSAIASPKDLRRKGPKVAAKHRTSSIPVDPDELPNKKKLFKPRKMVKSVSDPDILALNHTHFVSDQKVTANGDVQHSLHTSFRAGSDEPQVRRPSPPIRHCKTVPDDIIPNNQSGHSSFSRPLAAVFAKRSRSKDKDKEKHAKRLGTVFNSMDDLSEDNKETKTANSLDARAHSPPESSPRQARKGHKPGILKRMRTSLSHSESVQDTLGQTSNRLNHRSRSNTPEGSMDSLDSPLLQNSSELLESLGVMEKMVPPSPKTWTKSGYLWMQMKLPNDQFAWTHIFCVVDRSLGQLMVQEQSLPEPRKLENLLLCTAKPCTPDIIDRNSCFRVISPNSEHIFQALSDQDVQLWLRALKDGIAGALMDQDPTNRKPFPSTATQPNSSHAEPVSNAVAMATVLMVPGNDRCADCSSTEVEWASINLGIVLCIACSGVHRGLGVHVTKVRSLTLDKWDKTTVEFMQLQGNTKSNSYYEAKLGSRQTSIKKPSSNASKSERSQFINMKYVSLSFVAEDDNRSTHL